MKFVSAACFFALAPCVKAEVSPADVMLSEVISHPGSYSQVCDITTSKSDVPYRAFEVSDFSESSLSRANLALVKKNRDALVKAIRARLLEIDFSREPQRPSEDPKPEENNDAGAYGNDPKSLSPLLLALIHELNGIEALPELLVVEQKLVDGIGKSKEDSKIVPPRVDGWGVVEERASPAYEEDEAKGEQRHALFQARVAQRDLVMLIAVLMRDKAYQPYLATSIEARYVKSLKAMTAKFKLPKVSPEAEAPTEVEGLEVVMDPVTHLLRPTYEPVFIPYSRESRDEVRAAASKWIQEHT